MRHPMFMAASALAAFLITAGVPATHAQAPTTTEQIDEKIAHAIGMEAVFYGFAPRDGSTCYSQPDRRRPAL